MSKSVPKKSFRIDDLLSRKSGGTLLIPEDSDQQDTHGTKIKPENYHPHNIPTEGTKQFWEDGKNLRHLPQFRKSHPNPESSSLFGKFGPPSNGLPLPLYLPEHLSPFSSMGPLTHYRDAVQHYHDFVNSSQIPFTFYNNPSHPGLPAISAFRTLRESMSPEELAAVRSFSHQPDGYYAASLAYLSNNASPFSMASLLGNNGNKRKGGQIRFTNFQTAQLEKSFLDHKYLNANDRKKLANSLGLSDRQVKTWFQNRRAKLRKTKELNCVDIDREMVRSSSSERQSYSPDPGNCDSPATSGHDTEDRSP
ncbi:unnamed protein product [Allacma fusca]|uniref:Homeobox domain-containing protein n=1 Tax=Allacma fusca TaxID=39272 RepID=A0A8J2JKI5_9HEXA|nr:unnamed protein product [Allacma fusca]